MRKILSHKYFYIILTALFILLAGTFLLNFKSENESQISDAGSCKMNFYVRTFTVSANSSDDYGVEYAGYGEGGYLTEALDSSSYSTKGGRVEIEMYKNPEDKAKPNFSYSQDNSIYYSKYSSTNGGNLFSGRIIVNFNVFIYAYPNDGYIVSNIIDCNSLNPTISSNSRLYLDSSITGTGINIQGYYGWLASLREDYCFYVVFAPKFITINLDANGGSLQNGNEKDKVVAPYSSILENNQKQFATLPIPTKPNYIFKGWAIEGTN